MSRKNRTPEENARRAKIHELLQEVNISSIADIQSLFRETVAEFMENGLEAELDEELGYSKYDFRNKGTDNSRNGHGSKRLEGRKDVLDMWVGENESAKYWATVLSGLKNRGVNDIFIACTDNLTGFSNAINAVFPQTDIQNCIIH